MVVLLVVFLEVCVIRMLKISFVLFGRFLLYLKFLLLLLCLYIYVCVWCNLTGCERSSYCPCLFLLLHIIRTFFFLVLMDIS